MEQWNSHSILRKSESNSIRILQKGITTSGFEEEERFILILEGYDRSYCKNCLKKELPNFDFVPDLTIVPVDELAREILSSPDIEGVDIVGTDSTLQKHALNQLMNILKSQNKLEIERYFCYDDEKIMCLSQDLTAREKRERKHKLLINKYRFGHIQCTFPIFQHEYETTILNLTPPKLFTIHSIICFAYLDKFSPPDSPYWDLSKDARGHSLNSLVQDLSLQCSPQKVQDADLDSNTNTNPTESHFKTFCVTCRRKLTNFFSYILDEESYEILLGKSSNITLTIFDYNFIRYLLSDNAHNNINSFINGQYDEIDVEFQKQLYIGLYRLEHLHGIRYHKEKFLALWNYRTK